AAARDDPSGGLKRDPILRLGSRIARDSSPRATRERPAAAGEAGAASRGYARDYDNLQGIVARCRNVCRAGFAGRGTALGFFTGRSALASESDPRQESRVV